MSNFYKSVFGEDADTIDHSKLGSFQAFFLAWATKLITNSANTELGSVLRLTWASVTRSWTGQVNALLDNKSLMKKLEDTVDNVFKYGTENFRGKDLLKSKIHKGKSSLLVSEGNLEEALQEINQALLWSSKNSTNYVECLEQRAKILFELGQFECSLLDINDALDLNIWSESVCPLHVLKYKALVNLSCETALDAQQEALHVIQTSSIPETETMKEEVLKYQVEPNQIKMQIRPPSVQVEEPNEYFEDASADIRLEHDSNKGRVVYANVGIRKNSVLMMDIPVILYLDPKYYDTHCYSCAKRLRSRFVPCSNCTVVRFCSEKCCQNSWTADHRLECDIIEAMKHFERRQWMASRFYRKYFPSNTSWSDESGQESLLSSQSKDQKCLKRTPEQIRTLCPTKPDTSFVLCILEIFHALLHQRLYSSQWPLKTLIAHLRHCSLQMLCNCFHLVDHQMQSTRKAELVLDADRTVIGRAVYLSASMFSSRCVNRNADYTFFGNRIVVISRVDIEKDQEVTVTYADYMTQSVKSRRAQILTSRGYVCHCKDCLSGFERSEFKCSQDNTCDGYLILYSAYLSYCTKCGWQFVFGSKTLKVLNKAKECGDSARHSLEAGHPEEAKFKIEEALDLWSQVGHKNADYLKFCKYLRGFICVKLEDFETTSFAFKDLLRETKHGSSTQDTKNAVLALATLVNIRGDCGADEGSRFSKIWNRLKHDLLSYELVLMNPSESEAFNYLDDHFKC